MKLSSNRSIINWVVILVSFIIVSLILWNTYRFFQKFKDEERIKMENFSEAQRELVKTQDLDGNISELPLTIIQSNTTTPMIIEDSKGVFQSNNVEIRTENNQQYLKKLSEKFAKENTQIQVIYNGEVLSTLYYGNSDLLNKLKYYPLALVLIIVLFLGLIYFFLSKFTGLLLKTNYGPLWPKKRHTKLGPPCPRSLDGLNCSKMKT
jgi:ABC-type multidrug transport system fused ATPase/permease subunit